MMILFVALLYIICVYLLLILAPKILRSLEQNSQISGNENSSLLDQPKKAKSY